MAAPLIELGDGWEVLAEDISGMRPHDNTPPGGSATILFQMETDGVTSKAIKTWVLLSNTILIGSPLEYDDLLARWKETLEIASGQTSLAGHST